MHLKRLQAFGFKSFADRMDFEFGRGVTGIVGPNGCGKSNVVDAVKWALGEQRPTSVRGTEMADVIFAGTASRKPLGLAEVSLTFDNGDRFLPVDADEVVLTRRLYRDGTSEYLLNREAARLKDIRDVLLDTGGGRGALSILEQGKMDAVLQENPVERRMVFEEAAGIARYRLRQRETHRRIEVLDENLARLRDILAEREKQLRSMRAQAGRAERFRALEQELHARRVEVGLWRYARLLEERREAGARVAELAARESEAEARRVELSGDLRGREGRVEDVRGRAAALEAEAGKAEGAAEAAEERAASAEKLGAELEGRIRWYGDEIASTELRLAEARGEARAAIAAEAEAEGGVAAREADLAVAEAAIGASAAATREAAEGARALRARALDLLDRRGRAASARARLAAEEEGLRAAADRLAARREGAAREEEGLRAAAADAEASALAAAAGTAAAAAALEGEEGEVRVLEARGSDLGDRLAALDRAVHAARSRLDVLTALRDRHEGMGKGALRILEEARKAGGLRGVRGVLADLLEAEPADAEAVELALGPFAEAIVVDTFEDARAAITLLKEEGIGRALFLPLDGARALPAAPAPAPAEGAAPSTRPAASAVRCGDELRALVEGVLAGTVLAEDLDAARALAAAPAAPGGASRVVTGGGEVLGAEGGVAGGRGDGAGHGMVARNAEIRTLRTRLANEERRLAGLRRDLRDSEGRVGEARLRAEEARRGLRAREDAAAAARAAAERAAADLARAAEEVRVLRGEEGEAAEALARCAAGLAEAAAAEESFAAEERELEALQAASHEAEARAEHARRASEERRAEARVELARAIERRAGAGRRRESAERTLADGDRNLGLARTELGNCRARLEECARTAAAGRAEAERARERRERAIGDLALAREEARAAAEALEEARRGAAVLDGESRACRESLEEYRLKESESRMRLEGLVDRMREEARVDLAALHAERTAPPAAPPAPAAEPPAGEPPAGEASPAGLDLSVFDPPAGDPPPAADAPPPAPFDPEAAEREIQEIRLKIDRMGAVNLEALDQLGGVEKETGDLRTQEKDLAKAREELLEALRLLNRQSRERFLETFEAIRGHFNETFRRLFGGGKADVYLDEGEDVLEAGVEVVARPPGKELRSISLLSGGERAMTAVALLFAVYRARPSPFCVLDEVDAPLDESNVGRFAAMVREFTDGSQFIVITHNKRTMSTCDRLYGISMAEPGVSSRVLLELERVAEGEGASAAVEAA